MGTSRPGTVLVISPILEGKSNAVVLHCCCRFIWFPVGPPLKGVEYFFCLRCWIFFCLLSRYHLPCICNSLELEPVILHGICYILAWSLEGSLGFHVGFHIRFHLGFHLGFYLRLHLGFLWSFFRVLFRVSLGVL